MDFDKILTAAGEPQDARQSVLVALRCWQASKYAATPAASRVYIQRANHTALLAQRRNPTNLQITCLCIFISIEAGHFDHANALLDSVLAYKKYLRAQEPRAFGVLCFLYAYLESRQMRVRSAKRHQSALVRHMRDFKDDSFGLVMQGRLHLQAGNLPQAQAFLVGAWSAKNRSVFLHDALLGVLLAGARVQADMPVLSLLTYAARRGADVTRLADLYADALAAQAQENPDAAQAFFAASKHPGVLKVICTRLIARNDTSVQALHYYNEAKKHQVFMPGLFAAIVQASHSNNAASIEHFTMAQFLSVPQDFGSDLMMYAAHQLICDPAHEDLLAARQPKIMQLAKSGLASGIANSYANSVYCYFWHKCRALGISGPDVARAKEMLRGQIFCHELRTDARVRHVYVQQPHLRSRQAYKVADGRVVIEAANSDFAVTAMDAGRKNVLPGKITALASVANVGEDLCAALFDEGDRRANLAAYLADCYMRMPDPPARAGDVYAAVLADKAVTAAYHHRVLAALGRFHHAAGQLDLALASFGDIDDAAIGAQHLLPCLGVLIEAREFARAINLMQMHEAHIDCEAAAVLVQRMLAGGAAPEMVAPLAYRLLGDAFDAALLTIVMSHYDASFYEMADLARRFDENAMQMPQLDEKVVEMALLTGSFCALAQKSFVRIYGTASSATLVKNFIEMAKYEMLVNSMRPEYDVIDILQKEFFAAPDEILALGLACIYGAHKITTFKSDEIFACALDFAERRGFLLPALKTRARSAYAHKHQAFVYKSSPGKTCVLTYRASGSRTSRQMPMQYLCGGLYVANLPVFYNETITYCFSEEMASGSVQTHEEGIKNDIPYLHNDKTDAYFVINNAIIHECMFKHAQAEDIISELVYEPKPLLCKLQ